MEDSTAMTIDFLRARLLAERSVSRTARQRADELAQRVMELEEQLKIVSLQRKKAEKATAEVLAILENHGRSDVSETFDSSSDQEADVVTSSVKGEEPSINGKHRENDGDTFSGSERESSTQIGRSLSWKSRRDSLRSLEKKYMDSSRRRRSSFASSDSSSPKHVGKSCRQIRRREHRSAAEQSQNDSRSAPCEDEVITSSEGVNTCSDIAHETSREGPENRNERDLEDAPVSVGLGSRSVSNGHYLNNHRGDRDMEIALQQQAQLIGQFEAEEKAQREWEEKFRENNGSTPDSCDPGNQSDITEERDESKSVAPSFSNGMITSQNPEDAFGEGDTSNEKVFKAPSAQPSEGKVEEENLDSHQHSPDLRHMPVNDYAHISSTEVHNSSKGEAPEITNDLSLMPQENSNKLGSVLEALQQAKLSIRQNLNRSPLQEDGMIQRAIEPSFPAVRYRDRYAMPVGPAGLFRLPTDYQYEVTGRVNSLGSASELSMSNYTPAPDPAGADFSLSPYRESNSSSFKDDHFFTVPTFPYPEIRSRVPAALPSFGNRYTNVNPHSSAGLPTRSLVSDPSPSAGVPSYGGYTNLDPHSSAGLPIRSLVSDPSLSAGVPSYGGYTNLDPHSSAGLPTRSLVSDPSPSAGIPSYGRYTNLYPRSNAGLPAMPPTFDPIFDTGQLSFGRYSNLHLQSSAGLPSSSRFSHTPDLKPRMPSDGGVSSFISNRDVSLSPSGFSFYDEHTRPNMYR